MEQFTKYETARIIGARALQIAMDAPLLLKISEDELKAIRYDALKIAEKELKEGVLPITINRPSPRRGTGRLSFVKEDSVSDEEILEKAQALEKEIVQDAKEIGLVNVSEDEEESTEMGHESSEEK